MHSWFYCWLYGNSCYPKLRNHQFLPHQDKVSLKVAVTRGLNTTPEQIAEAAVFFRSSIGFDQGTCETSSQVHLRVGCAAAQQSRAQPNSSGASLSTRHLVFRKPNTRNPFSLALAQPEEAPTRVVMRNFCPPLSSLENTVPVRMADGESWNSVGLSNHFWFFCYSAFLQGTNTITCKTWRECRAALPMNGTHQ